MAISESVEEEKLLPKFTDLRSEVIRGNTIHELEKFVPEWRDLVCKSSANWIYSLPEWCLSWYKSLGQGGELKIIIVRDTKGALVGLAPMWHGHGSWSELRVKKMEFVSGVQADYHDLIIERGKEETIVPILMKEIMSFSGKVDVVELRQIPQTSPNLPFIRDCFKARNVRFCEQQGIAPYCLLEGDYSYMERCWKASHRGDVRRQKKRLNELGKLELTVYKKDEEILKDIEDFFKTHTERWRAAGYPAMFLNTQYRDFYREIIRSIGIKGGLHFSKLTIDGIPISYHLGFIHNDRFYWYKPVFRIEYEKYSPSKVHISLLMEEGFKQGWRVFDFLIGSEPYKYQWNTKEVSCVTAVVRGHGLSGVLGYEWLRWGRELFKNSLKGKFLERIRALYIEGRLNQRS